MRIGVLEWATAGGSKRQEMPASIAEEGWAMCRAVLISLLQSGQQAVALVDQPRAAQCANDPVFAAFPPGQLTLVERDRSRRQWRSTYESCDRTLLIAPEMGGILQRMLKRFSKTELPTCNGSPRFVRNASNKWITARKLRQQDLPHPPTRRLSDATRPWLERQNADHRFRVGTEPIWVLKPIDGVGCEGIVRLTTADILKLGDKKRFCGPKDWLVQPWLQGQALSRAAIVDQSGTAHWLPVVRQHLSLTDNVVYRGGTVEPDLAAQMPALDDLFNRALDCLGRHPRGWIGIDFLWNPSNAVQPITIIEVNPRLTTSFVGLSAAGSPNLAWLIVAAAMGQTIQLPTAWQKTHFSSTGIWQVEK